MNERILFVDDEPNILSGIRRQLKGKYDLVTAESGKTGLEIIKKEKEFSVVISDYKMPVMNGDEFLSEVKKLSSDTVRMMLTGQADMEAVIKVINEGSIFRFLTKPCPPELLQKNIDEGIKQNNLIKSEKKLLSKTLGGSLQVMTDILVLAKPQAFNRGLRVKEIVKKMLKFMKIDNQWQIEIAAMLSQIGCVTVPDTILTKVYKSMSITPEDLMIYQQHTRTSSEIISKIPRLEKVAEIIAYQEKYFNGTGFPKDDRKGNNLPLGSRMLRLALDYDNLIQMNITESDALERVKKRQGWYDDKILELLEKTIKGNDVKRKFSILYVNIDEMNEEMYLADDIVSATGIIIGNNKQKVTKTLIVTLKNYLNHKEIKEPVSILTYSNHY